MTRLADLTDAELVDRFAAGEAAAFEVLLRRYERPVYTFILRSARHPDVAADLLQETFTRLIQHCTEWNRSAKLSTYLFSIARNLCVDHARRMRHRRHPSLDTRPQADDDGPTLLERIAARAPDSDAQAEGARIRARIAQAVEDLPEEQREVFLLRQVQSMHFSEIAAVVGASENTVKSRMRYALERLQAALAEYEDEARAKVS